jgi:TetR/AcrR family transcriptional regulator
MGSSTRDRILSAALVEFAERGLAGARVDEIARRAEINKQALYYYFGNKDRLFQATLTFGYGRGLSPKSLADNESIPADKSMRQLIGRIFDHFRASPLITNLIADENRYHGEHLTPEVRAEIKKAVAPMKDAIGAILERGQREGLFSKEIDAVQVYLTIVSTCMFYFGHAFTLSAIVGADLLDEKEIARRRRHIVHFLIAGLRIQPTS